MQSDNKWNCREDRTTVFLLQFLMREKFGHLSNAGLLTNFILQVWQSDTSTFSFGIKEVQMWGRKEKNCMLSTQPLSFSVLSCLAQSFPYLVFISIFMPFSMLKYMCCKCKYLLACRGAFVCVFCVCNQEGKFRKFMSSYLIENTKENVTRWPFWIGYHGIKMMIVLFRTSLLSCKYIINNESSHEF